MQSFAQVGILPADYRETRGQFRIDESADQCDQSARDPNAHDERGRLHALRDQVGVDENSRADDAAYHSHDGAEKTELTSESLMGRIAFEGSGIAGRSHASF